MHMVLLGGGGGERGGGGGGGGYMYNIFTYYTTMTPCSSKDTVLRG